MESPQQFMARIRRLEQLACLNPEDRPVFEALMEEAKRLNLSYKDALEYTIRIRNGGAD
jgi:hypothetical protein